MPPPPRKLIEVDLPLDAINAESAREKSIRHGHPSTLHLWWARRCRAVIFASLVDDPADCPHEFPTIAQQRAERQRLHDLIKRLVKWENSSDPDLLAEARYEIARSVARARQETAPDAPDAVLQYLNRRAQPIYDPFCGGGSIPLEAQRLGLRAIGSDLNPVAVLITKALIELPPKFANRPPVNPDSDPMGLTIGKGKNARQTSWRGAAGLAADIRYYGRQMRALAYAKIGHLYPQAQLPDGGATTVIAWLWARTVPCPNPACGVTMPLMTTFQASKKRGNEHWMWPQVDQQTRTVTRNAPVCRIARVVGAGSVRPAANRRRQPSLPGQKMPAFRSCRLRPAGFPILAAPAAGRTGCSAPIPVWRGAAIAQRRGLPAPRQFPALPPGGRTCAPVPGLPGTGSRLQSWECPQIDGDDAFGTAFAIGLKKFGKGSPVCVGGVICREKFAAENQLLRAS